MQRMSLKIPVIGILRGIDPSVFPQVMEASFGAGLQAIEVTVNTDGALDMVEKSRPAVPEGKYLGMGTVRNADEAKSAILAGAMFLVTPNLDLGVIEYARARKVPIIAGAFSPTEVYAAWSAGADMVKVFPCGRLGPGYIKDLRGPFELIPLVAVGGVGEHNVAEYFDAGATAVGVGTSLFGKDAIASADRSAIAANVARFLGRCPRKESDDV